MQMLIGAAVLGLVVEARGSIIFISLTLGTLGFVCVVLSMTLLFPAEAAERLNRIDPCCSAIAEIEWRMCSSKKTAADEHIKHTD